MLGVSRSGYYQYLKRKIVLSPPNIIGAKVQTVFKKSRSTYGTRRIKKALEQEGVIVGRTRIKKEMQTLGLVAKARRKTRRTTHSNHKLSVAPNRLARQFDTKEPNQAWGTDITYIQTTEGFLYLATVLDLFSRKIVGWAISNRMKKELALAIIII